MPQLGAYASGVLTALEHSATLLVAVTTVDMPNVRRTDLEWLIAGLDDAPDVMAVMSRRGDRVEPFPAAYRTAAAAAISAGWLSLPPKPPPMRRH